MMSGHPSHPQANLGGVMKSLDVEETGPSTDQRDYEEHVSSMKQVSGANLRW